MKRIEIQLSTESIRKALHEIEQYKEDMNRKVNLFVSRLSEYGISVAKSNTGTFDEYITFSKEITNENDEYVGTIVMSNLGLVKSEWKVKGGTREVEINPILMSEFGSGFMADSVRGKEFGAGQGTLNTYGHAFDKKGWWWVDMQGVKHHSWGERPNKPLFKSAFFMRRNILNIAKEVFGNG